MGEQGRDTEEEISTQPGLVVLSGQSIGTTAPGSSSASASWPAVISSALLAGSNAVSALIAYQLAKPIAATIPPLLLETYARTGWAPPTIAGLITMGIAAPLGLKYAGRLAGAGTSLVTAIKGLTSKGSAK